MLAGFAIADNASGDLQAVINGFAGGAGLVTVLGFAVAAALSGLD